MPPSPARVPSIEGRVRALEIDLAQHEATDNAVLGEIRSDIGDLKKTNLQLASDLGAVKTAVTSIAAHQEGIKEGRQAPWWAPAAISAAIALVAALLGFTGWLGARVLDDERAIAVHSHR
jgi:RecG-like helicase